MPILEIFLILAAGVIVWVQWVEPNWFQLRKKTLRLKKPLPAPLTVLHLSDFHFTRPRLFLDRFFDRLARLEVDFVFVTGDFIDGPKGITPCVRNLKKLRPRQGIYGVFGNHDYEVYPFPGMVKRLFTARSYGWKRPEFEDLKRALREAGVRLLVNENVLAPVGGGEVSLVGVDDPFTGHADFDQAFQGVNHAVLRIALIHTPAAFPAFRQRGIDIAFAGHTHGGQVRMPGVGPLPFLSHLEPIIDSTNQYGFVGLVSRGLAATPRIRFRLFCRPEAVLVRIEGQ